MKHDTLEKLIAIFKRFPGIGSRQAARFAYHLVDESDDTLKDLSELINKTRKVSRCKECFRITDGPEEKCRHCSSMNGPQSTMVVLEKDADLENFEKSGVFSGYYHILGGTLSAIKPESRDKLRLRELFERVKKYEGIKEIVLATSATAEGDFTARYTEKILEPLAEKKKIKITRLGRGLSSGAEIEYLDPSTIQKSFEARK